MAFSGKFVRQVHNLPYLPAVGQVVNLPHEFSLFLPRRRTTEQLFSQSQKTSFKRAASLQSA